MGILTAQLTFSLEQFYSWKKPQGQNKALNVGRTHMCGLCFSPRPSVLIKKSCLGFSIAVVSVGELV